MNPRKILIVGFQPHDAGKTILGKALIYGFKEAGVQLTPFKPHSGISYWIQFDAFQASLSRGALICSDIAELEAASRSGVPLEGLNPVNRLSHPFFRQEAQLEEQVFEEFLIERFTHHRGSTYRSTYYVNGSQSLDGLRGVREFLSRVIGSSEKVKVIKSFRDLVKAYSDHFDEATTSCYRSLGGRPLLVESFNDAAYPFRGAEECDTVLCASSNLILLMDAPRYFKSMKAREVGRTCLQLTVPEVYSSILLKERFRVNPLTNREKSDPEKLVENYSNVIGAVL